MDVRRRVLWIGAFVAIALVTVLGEGRARAPATLGARASTATPAEPSAAEISAAERELADFWVARDSYYPKSAEEVVARVRYIFVGTVTAVGPTFNGVRLGERGELGPDPSEFHLGQSYVVEVEHYLKGSGPNPIHVSQGEGWVPEGMQPTAARIVAARKRYAYTPLLVGGRYLLLTYSVERLPELDNLGVYPLDSSPGRFLLTDGMVTVDNPNRTDVSAAGMLFPDGSEEALVKKLEKLIAEQNGK